MLRGRILKKKRRQIHSFDCSLQRALQIKKVKLVVGLRAICFNRAAGCDQSQCFAFFG